MRKFTCENIAHLSLVYFKFTQPHRKYRPLIFSITYALSEIKNDFRMKPHKWYDNHLELTTVLELYKKYSWILPLPFHSYCYRTLKMLFNVFVFSELCKGKHVSKNVHLISDISAGNWRMRVIREQSITVESVRYRTVIVHCNQR
jgi:hypothetical protein